jgi:DNA-directed RNA polymerase subunit H
MGRFRVMDHFLVPEHVRLDVKEAKEVLDTYKITKDQLPKIKMSDPCIRALEAQGVEVNPKDIIKVIRKSKTSGTSVAYRVVID